MSDAIGFFGLVSIVLGLGLWFGGAGLVAGGVLAVIVAEVRDL